MKLTETKLRSIIREELQKLSEMPARTGVGGSITADEQGEVYGVKDPRSRYGGDMLAVDVVRRGGKISIERVLGYSSGKPVDIRSQTDMEMIKRQIENGEAEKLNVPFMAQP
jgi:hypothetical protein